MMDPKPMDLYEFLVESELQHYYNSIKNELKISMVLHLKYASDEDLKQVGLSKPEIRRLRKFYEKVYPHGYLSKIKRLLHNPVAKRDEGQLMNSTTSLESIKLTSSPTKIPNNKHIIPADSICVNKQLGTGEFGIVQQGVWTNGNERIQVAIKCLCRERMQSNPMEFLKEAAIMHSIEHENIVRLYGVVLDTDSLMLVTELAHLRSLLECLKDSGLRVSFLTVPTLCEFAAQICNGMQYLEAKRLIHRDLAARNILVFSKNKVKISDFGLSRALGVGKDYYQTNFNVNLKLPIAWCAPECINFLRFTNASDVWAYGVCLWEMFSYGFQPWAALTGHQILEAIDEPNYQRLEAPECCPRDYYNLMLRCWQHDPLKRPKFTEIGDLLPDMKPEQLKTIQSYSGEHGKKDYLLYRQNEIISVLDKSSTSTYWKGVLNSGKTGLFNPVNTVTYLGSLPSSSNPNRDSFCRTADRSSKRKLRTEMISNPQNDFKHTGHVGLDGAYFGDVAFYSSNGTQSYNQVPRQIVTPYKPSEDIEQTPLLLPATPTSPDSLQTASGYFSESNGAMSLGAIGPENGSMTAQGIDMFGSAFNFNHSHTSAFTSSNPFAQGHDGRMAIAENGGGFTNANMDESGYSKGSRPMPSNFHWPNVPMSSAAAEDSHEYHEISDDEINADKAFDLGPSLLDEMDIMFQSLKAATNVPGDPSEGAANMRHPHHVANPPQHGSSNNEPISPDFIDSHNKKNEIAELTSILQHSRRQLAAGVSSTLGMTNKSKKNKGAGTVKAISVKDERILNQAIDYANEISARSMTDLVSDTPVVAQSPKRKFSFRFPNLTHHGSIDKDAASSGVGSAHNGQHGSTSGASGSTTALSYGAQKNRNFSEELNNVPDLQNTITDECREAYNSLVEKPATGSTPMMGRFDFEKPIMGASMTLPRLMSDGHKSSMKPQPKKPSRLDISAPRVVAHTNTLPSSRPPNLSTSPAEPDTNPLRILRDKNFPIVRPRMKVAVPPVPSAAAPSRDAVDPDQDGVCESPSYLTQDQYSFDEVSTPNASGNREIENLNPIPLPPRDRNKPMPVNTKRHVRKHPLIIPVSGLQRTLSKVVTPVDEKDLQFPSEMPSVESVSAHQSIGLPRASPTTKQQSPAAAARIDYAHKFIENNFPSTSKVHGASTDRTYENMDTLRFQMPVDCTDSASLHFESILEDSRNVADVLASPDVTDGDFMFEIQKDLYYKPGSAQPDTDDDVPDEIRNLDIEQKKLAFSKKYPKYVQPQNELANNILFNKLKESAEATAITDGARGRPVGRQTSVDEVDGSASTSGARLPKTGRSVFGDSLKEETDSLIPPEPGLLQHSNSVSCEDLLEFSDQKPKGRERGVESDEVRIMTKVLGGVATSEQFIEALNFIDWDVHKAIKLIMLRKTLSDSDLTLQQCVDALQLNEWDMQTTTIRLKGQ